MMYITKMSINGALRTARDELIPQMARLGPQLLYEDRSVLDALHARVAAQGFDPGCISEENINKAERHILAGFFIGEQRRYLLEGLDEPIDIHQAQFKHQYGSAVTLYTKRGKVWLERDLRETLTYGAEVVENNYRDGLKGGWWPAAFVRYGRLGLRAVELAESHPAHVKAGPDAVIGIPKEGIDLRRALRNKALPKNLPTFLDYVGRQVPEPENRLKAAHDLFYLLAMFAGLHLQEFRQSFGMGALMNVPVRVDSDGKYRADLAKSHDLVRVAYPHLDPQELANAKLKCAAHANVVDWSLATEAADQESVITRHTDLERFGHAAINAAMSNYII